MVAMDIMVVMAMIIIIVMLVMFIMVIRTDRKTRTNGQTGHLNLTFQVTCVGQLSQFLRCFAGGGIHLMYQFTIDWRCISTF